MQLPNGSTKNISGTATCPSVATPEGDVLEPIAVIGFSIRFPQDATSPDGLWKIIYEGRSVMTEVPPERFNIDGFYHPEASHPGTINARGGYFLKDDIAAFDAPFFSMNPSEVESMDPQQRCLLETSYHALEAAGIPIEQAVGSKTSVYVGCVGVEYDKFFDMDEEIQPQYKATGTGSALLSNRLSWFYDFRGPSMAIETACSSSMIALHLACQSIRNEESTMSLVCGSQLYLEPLTSAIALSTLQFMSPDGRCHSFDERANGYAKGEGFGVLVLKPLADAVAAGDTIRAVIRSTATNQDGRTPGITQPSPEAQEEQIRTAYQRAGLDLGRTRLFEAHGTGTKLGDPIEAQAIASVFGKHRSPEDPMYVGAVKSNIGHLEATAGIAGIVKAILSLERGIIPPIADYKTTNHRIQADKWHLRFPEKPIPWPAGLRRASVNSFGYGGSNAHVVLDDAYNYLRERGIDGKHCTVEEAPSADEIEKDLVVCDSATIQTSGEAQNGGDCDYEDTDVAQRSDIYVFVWSASEATGADRLASIYRDYLSKLPPARVTPTYLRNLAYTLSNKRSVLPWKSYVLASTAEALEAKLEKMPSPTRSSTPPTLFFILTGQGAELGKIGIELLQFPEFQQSLAAAESYFKSLGCSWSLSAELKNSIGSPRLADPALAQPICTAIQVALIELLAAWNIRPRGVVGHSSGEIAAAFCVGAVPRESAWSIAYFRGVLASKLALAVEGEERGGMMSVQMSEEKLQPLIEQLTQTHGEGCLSIGCQNSAYNNTVTGLETYIDRLKEMLDEDDVFARKLKIPVAYHSRLMQPVAEEYRNLLRSVCPPKSPTRQYERPLIASTVTGNLIGPEELSNPEYWVLNLISTCKFSRAMESIRSGVSDISTRNQRDCYVEIGSHPILQRPVKESAVFTESSLFYPTLRRDTPALEALMTLAGNLFLAGHPVNLEKANDQGCIGEAARMLADLPKYPFNHSQRYWLESRLFKNYLQRENIRHELLGHRSLDWNPSRPRWRHTLRLSDMPWLEDHQVNGSVIYPAAGMIAMVIEAARSLSEPKPEVHGYRLRDVMILNALVIPPKPDGLEIQLYMEDQKNKKVTNVPSINSREFTISSFAGNEWRDVISGTIITEYNEKSRDTYSASEDVAEMRDAARASFQEITNNCLLTTNHENFYNTGREIGYNFGPAFQTLREITYDASGRYAGGTIEPNRWKNQQPAKKAIALHNTQCVIHPTALDGVLQTAAALSTKGGSILGPLLAPTQFREIWVSSDLLSWGVDTAMRVAAKIERVAIRDIDATIVALHSGTLDPVIRIHGYRSTTVAQPQVNAPERQDIFYSLEWKADVELLSRSGKEHYCIQQGGTCTFLPTYCPCA